MGFYFGAATSAALIMLRISRFNLSRAGSFGAVMRTRSKSFRLFLRSAITWAGSLDIAYQYCLRLTGFSIQLLL